MATFECKVYKLTIEEHPNADLIELAGVGDYRSIVGKGQFKTGDLGVYIPEAAVCPEWLIKELGLEGKLAGKKHNRVKAVKLRGVLSQGLIYPVLEMNVNGETQYSVCGEAAVNPASNSMNDNMDVEEGTDVTEFLGITKWEPPIPVHMQGEVYNAFGLTPKYDIENFKMYPDVLQEGEEVIMTEKIHGTWCCFGWHPDNPEDCHIITSKGMSEKGLAFKLNDANAHNLYVRALRSTENASGKNIIERAMGFWGGANAFYILGEVYGPGIQKGFTYGINQPRFRLFDVYWGNPKSVGYYADATVLQTLAEALEVERVPELYRGPFSKDKMMELTSGKESVSGTEANMREGVVIRPVCEREHLELGRVILKSVSEEYLLRKGKTTEYN